MAKIILCFEAQVICNDNLLVPAALSRLRFKPANFPLSKYVICFHELIAQTMQHILHRAFLRDWSYINIMT